MKILAVRGCNLASLEGQFEIDFTQEPLKSAGIFAITGSTGSGKSTILDAICLPLFNKTPRTSKAESENMIDVKDKTISLSDPRNILRRGCGSGFAEVDFVAVTGESFRARWGVNRAHNKVDSAMQKYSLNVWNMKTGQELQGERTSLLDQIKQLLGLSFEQFTRAVLLAQGDFATFLKAKKSEKADLLEKLTGTDIYSKISTLIYEKTRDAENDHKNAEETLKGIALLSSDELNALDDELQNLIKEIQAKEQQEKNDEKKLTWITKVEQLQKELKEAEVQLQEAVNKLENAQPRFDFLLLLKSVQGFRESFNILQNAQKQRDDNQVQLVKKQEQLIKNNEDLQKANTAKDLVAKGIKELENRWEEVQPELVKAATIATQIESIGKILADKQKEFATLEKNKKTFEKKMSTLNSAIEKNQTIQSQLKSWFTKNKQYNNLISKLDAVTRAIQQAYSFKKMKSDNLSSIDCCEKILISTTNQLNSEKKELERLNEMLPSEVVLLRAKLIEGEPCPVCGSKHHETHVVTDNSLADKDLNERKQLLEQQIVHHESTIKNKNEEKAALLALVNNYSTSYQNEWETITTLMQGVENWHQLFEAGDLVSQLQQISKQWKENETVAQEQTHQLEMNLQAIGESSKQYKELLSVLKEKQGSITVDQSQYAQFQMTAKGLLGGKTAEQVKTLYQDQKKQREENLQAATQKYTEFNETVHSLKGNITQLEAAFKEHNEKAINAEAMIKEVLAKREDHLTLEQLFQLLEKDNAWMLAEQEALNKLNEGKAKAKTLQIEREQNYKHHSNLEEKPALDETKELLLARKQNVNTQLSAYKTRYTEIEVAIKSNDINKKKAEASEKDLAQKSAVAERWKKLNTLFGSADGAKFKTIAQGYTLDLLLAYANQHLVTITQRYSLERISQESLSLQVIDHDMLGEVRTVHSLSGGESFLISLALALGLSSLSSNRMQIESLFIDEGFGTLDADTLRMAMSALENLQSQQGRKIGVISHVAEMTERINTQVQVIKEANGKSKIKTVST